MAWSVIGSSQRGVGFPPGSGPVVLSRRRRALRHAEFFRTPATMRAQPLFPFASSSGDTRAPRGGPMAQDDRCSVGNWSGLTWRALEMGGDEGMRVAAAVLCLWLVGYSAGAVQ